MTVAQRTPGHAGIPKPTALRSVGPRYPCRRVQTFTGAAPGGGVGVTLDSLHPTGPGQSRTRRRLVVAGGGEQPPVRAGVPVAARAAGGICLPVTYGLTDRELWPYLPGGTESCADSAAQSWGATPMPFSRFHATRTAAGRHARLDRPERRGDAGPQHAGRACSGAGERSFCSRGQNLSSPAAPSRTSSRSMAPRLLPIPGGKS
jgi:hypothetical protein